MITIFSTPKNFEGIFDIIQQNAFNGWRALGNEVEIIIFGNSIGSEQNAKMINAVYLPDVRVTESGVPYLSDLFEIFRYVHPASFLLSFSSKLFWN